MRIHYLQHVPFEGLGIIENWIQSKGYELTFTRFYKNDRLPEVEEFDWLIIMGGPMSVNEEDKYSWLIKEKLLIKKAVDSGKIVMGICLGAQLIANVLGSKIYQNNLKEIGWFPVKKIEIKGRSIFSDFPEQFLAFHWHGETFDLPEGSIHLASSECCKNQAFLYKDKVLGLQFHFEMNEKNIQTIVETCKDELVPGKYVQNESQLLLSNSTNTQTSNILMKKILDYLSNR